MIYSVLVNRIMVIVMAYDDVGRQIFKPVEGSENSDETLVTVKGTPEQVDKVW